MKRAKPGGLSGWSREMLHSIFKACSLASHANKRDIITRIMNNILNNHLTQFQSLLYSSTPFSNCHGTQP